MIQRLKDLWAKWFGTGTADDRRNLGWRITEALRVTPEWSRYLFDLRLGFKRAGRWRSYLAFWKPVERNFWNGIFTLNVYVVKTTIKGVPVLIPRINLASRFAENYWFETGIGVLFDRGEFGAKLVIANWENEAKWNPPGDAKGWEEGGI